MATSERASGRRCEGSAVAAPGVLAVVYTAATPKPSPPAPRRRLRRPRTGRPPEWCRTSPSGRSSAARVRKTTRHQTTTALVTTTTRGAASEAVSAVQGVCTPMCSRGRSNELSWGRAELGFCKSCAARRPHARSNTPRSPHACARCNDTQNIVKGARAKIHKLFCYPAGHLYIHHRA